MEALAVYPKNKKQLALIKSLLQELQVPTKPLFSEESETVSFEEGLLMLGMNPLAVEARVQAKIAAGESFFDREDKLKDIA